MGLEQAKDKLKELLYYVSSSAVKWIGEAFDALEKFYEGEKARVELIADIIVAIKESLARAVEEGVIDVYTALDMYGEIMMAYGFRLYAITMIGNIYAFIEFLDEAIRILKNDNRYVEWTRRSWEGTMEIVKTIFKI